jgi:hypothetical protein
VYGLVAEFDNPEELATAVRRARREGYRHVEAFAPPPAEADWEAIRTRLPLLMLLGGLIGVMLGSTLLPAARALHLPLTGGTIGGWQESVAVTLQLGVLGAVLSGIVGGLVLQFLPRAHHPAFNVPGFDHGGQSRFFLSVLSIDPRYDPEDTPRFLEELHPAGMWEVPL